MSRSSKKGPFVNAKLLSKVDQMEASGKKTPIKTWSRSSMVSPAMVGHTFMVHNGKDFKEVFISEAMIGHRLGEFALTRKFLAHSKKGFEKPAEAVAAAAAKS